MAKRVTLAPFDAWAAAAAGPPWAMAGDQQGGDEEHRQNDFSGYGTLVPLCC